MDNLTHALAGALVCDALPCTKQLGPKAPLAAAIVAATPDFDMVPAFIANFPSTSISDSTCRRTSSIIAGMKFSAKKENSGFFRRVHDLVATIPQGKVATYGQIAKHLGGRCSARAVGFAMHAAPSVRSLPCHRVINAKGEMASGALFGGAAQQRKLLRSEGVRFRRDGTVNLEKSLYQFSGKETG